MFSVPVHESIRRRCVALRGRRTAPNIDGAPRLAAPATEAARPLQTRPSTRRESEISDDEFMVVPLDGLDVCVSAAGAWLRLGLPQVGTAISEVCPATSGATGSRYGRFHRVQPSRLGRGRRLRVDGDARRGVLGFHRVLVAMRPRTPPVTDGKPTSCLSRISEDSRRRAPANRVGVAICPRPGYTFHPRPMQPTCSRGEALRESAWR